MTEEKAKMKYAPLYGVAVFRKDGAFQPPAWMVKTWNELETDSDKKMIKGDSEFDVKMDFENRRFIFTMKKK